MQESILTFHCVEPAWGLNSGCQVWGHLPLCTEPSCQASQVATFKIKHSLTQYNPKVWEPDACVLRSNGREMLMSFP